MLKIRISAQAFEFLIIVVQKFSIEEQTEIFMPDLFQIESSGCESP